MTPHKKMHWLLLVLLLPRLAYSQAVKDLTPDKTIMYKTVGDTKLSLHVFMPSDHKPSDKRPAIVFFFGGGWVGGTPSQFYPQCEYLASRGMVAMSAEYRVKSVNHTSPCECVKDGKSAVRWIRQHAGELGIDPDRIAAGGGSAGGQVAAATGTTAGFNEDGEDVNVSACPNALVLFNPVFDNGPGGYGHDQVKDYWKDISPMHNISEKTPPTVVFLGTKDSLIPESTAEKYKALMTAKGRRCDLHLYEGQPHGFFNLQHRDNYNRTVIEVDRFLASLGYLKGPPTLQSPTIKASPAAPSWSDESVDSWLGYKRHRFTVDGCNAWVVEPRKALPGNPWTWCMEFPDAFTDRTGVPQLLEKGFHHLYIQVGNTFGCPAALKHLDALYATVTAKGLAPKGTLIGISRGGLYAYNWASLNPDKVVCIYGDAPVCDFKSWPGGKGNGTGSAGDWKELLQCYGFHDEAEALAWSKNPVDSLEPLAKAGIPLIHVVGDADAAVPVAENSAIVEQRYKALGGKITVFHKPGVGHHPHGLDDTSELVELILNCRGE